MDVDRYNFFWNLLHMLSSLAKAHFVSIDLELSGIQTKKTQQAKLTDRERTGATGKQRLQERYEEAKEAAEKYQVLQIGFTLVEKDTVRGSYLLSPYNLYVSPLIREERLEIERVFSFQSGAVEFLLSHGFNMEAPFTIGVPYLSREEESKAIQNELIRQDKLLIEDIMLGDHEVETKKFVKRARQDIMQWELRTIRTPTDYLNIAPEGREIRGSSERGLDNFQKRLIHQMIRADFPKLTSIGRFGFIQVVDKDQEREDAVTKKRMKSFKDKINRQIGLRWFLEAMSGGDLSELNPLEFASTLQDGVPKHVDIGEFLLEFEKAKSDLREKRPVLVGHNLFLDLVNLYRCFFGQLPDRVEDFQAIIHEMFPSVVDTKYVATHNNPDTRVKSGLDELYAEFANTSVPMIEVHPEHTKYENSTPTHEAGFDSFTTAKLLIYLSTKLHATGSYTHVGTELLFHPEDTTQGLDTTPEHAVSPRDFVVEQWLHNQHPSAVAPPVPLDTKPVIGTTVVGEDEKKEVYPLAQTAFSHPGMFDALAELAQDDDVAANKGVDNTASRSLRAMPPWESHFWSVYGNKLRVNGTLEGLCDLEADERSRVG